MINNTMDKIEGKIKNSIHITDENKDEYLKMIETLRQEISELSETEKDQAETITGFAGVTAHEATKNEQNPELIKISVDGLKTSIEGFEVSNPRLVSIVNSFCSLLSNLGI